MTTKGSYRFVIIAIMMACSPQTQAAVFATLATGAPNHTFYSNATRLDFASLALDTAAEASATERRGIGVAGALNLIDPGHFGPLGTSCAERRSDCGFPPTVFVRSAIPQPANWTMMIGGFCLIGFVMSGRSKSSLPSFV